MKTAMTYGELRRKLDYAADAAADRVSCPRDEVPVVGILSEDGDDHGISHVEVYDLHREGVIGIVFRGTIDWTTMRWTEPEDDEEVVS